MGPRVVLAAGILLAPRAVWWVHGRRVNGTATLGAVLDFVAGGVVVWLNADAVRDLSAKRRRHVRLDITRLVATVAWAAFCVSVIAAEAAGSEPDAGVYTALVLLAPGAVGAVIVTVADAIRRSYERQPHGHLISGP